jgi:hypothetical protein
MRRKKTCASAKTQMSVGKRTTILADYHHLVLSSVARQCAIRLCDMGHESWSEWLDAALLKLETLTVRERALVWRCFSELCQAQEIDPYDPSETATRLRTKLQKLWMAEHCTANLCKKTWGNPWGEYLALSRQLQADNFGPIGFVEEENPAVQLQPDLVVLSARAASVDLLWSAQPNFRIALYQIHCQHPPRVEDQLNFMADVLLQTSQRWQVRKSMEAEATIANALAAGQGAEKIQLLMAFHATAAVRAVENLAQLAGYAVANTATAGEQLQLQAVEQAYTRLADRIDMFLSRENKIKGVWQLQRWC